MRTGRDPEPADGPGDRRNLNRLGAFGLVVYVPDRHLRGRGLGDVAGPALDSSICGTADGGAPGALGAGADRWCVSTWRGTTSALLREVPRLLPRPGQPDAGAGDALGLHVVLPVPDHLLGNTTEEVSWYIQRARGGWGIISLALIPLHFFCPFLVLVVGSKWKRNLRRLGSIAFYSS